MDATVLTDALTNTAIVVDSNSDELFTVQNKHGEVDMDTNKCSSLFFLGCSMINYAMPHALRTYELLQDAGEADGISLLCCGKILAYESDGDVLRPAFESDLRDHLVNAEVKRIICACPNCYLALRNALSVDERTSQIELIALPELLSELGSCIDSDVASRIVKKSTQSSSEVTMLDGNDETVDGGLLLAPHDSCPDRDFGVYADGLRALMPRNMWADPAHSRAQSICCGSLPRAAGNLSAADKCADINGREAREVSADAIITPCVSCAFQLNMAQKHLRAYHYLELLFDMPIDWDATPGLMKIRFLFDDILGATEIDEISARKFGYLGKRDINADTDVSISNENTQEIQL